MSGSKDDPVGIPDGTRLFRRIDPTWLTYDNNRGEWRPNSQNFQDSKDSTPMSVFAENVAKAHGEFEKYRVKQDAEYISDFDQALARYLKGKDET